MSKPKKIIVFTGIVLCIVGICLLGVGLVNGGREYVKLVDFNNLNSSATDCVFTEKKIPLDNLTSINVTLENLDLIIQASEDKHYYLSYQCNSKNEKNPLSYTVDQQVLTLKEDNAKSSFISVDISWLNMVFNGKKLEQIQNYVILYVPEEADLEKCTIKIKCGHLEMAEVHSNSTDIELNYGDLTMRDCNLQDGEITLNNGDIETNRTELADLSVKSSYGDIELEENTLTNINIVMNNGDLETKRMTLYNQVTVENHYGDSDFQITQEAYDVTLLLNTDYGEIEVETPYAVGQSSYYEEMDSYQYTAKNEKACLTVKASNGDIRVQN